MARAEAREMVLSFRAIAFVILYAGLAGGMGYACDQIDQKSDGQITKAATQIAELPQEDRDEQIDKIVEETGASASDASLLRFFADDTLPLKVKFVLLVSTFIIPALIFLIGFNRISDDIHTKYTRYVLQRVHRGPYLAGKIFGHWLVSFLAVVLVQLSLLIVGDAFDVFELSETLPNMPVIWAGFAIFVLAYVAFMAVFSSWLTPPIAALFLALIALFALKMGTAIGSLAYKPIGRAWLGSWDYGLWRLEPMAVAVYLAYAGLFTGLAYWILRRRDL